MWFGLFYVGSNDIKQSIVSVYSHRLTLIGYNVYTVLSYHKYPDLKMNDASNLQWESPVKLIMS